MIGDAKYVIIKETHVLVYDNPKVVGEDHSCYHVNCVMTSCAIHYYYLCAHCSQCEIAPPVPTVCFEFQKVNYAYSYVSRVEKVRDLVVGNEYTEEAWVFPIVPFWKLKRAHRLNYGS